MSTLDTIRARRSVREFTAQDVSEEILCQILEAGRWAPSGLNNQPWRFAIVRDRDCIEQLSLLTKYTKTVLGANLLIVVLLDNNVVYSRTKDVQAIGACIQNMLLAIHDLGLGACWIGEILNQGERVLELLGLSGAGTQGRGNCQIARATARVAPTGAVAQGRDDCRSTDVPLELMAVLAVGYPADRRRVSRRKAVEELVICRKYIQETIARYSSFWWWVRAANNVLNNYLL